MKGDPTTSAERLIHLVVRDFGPALMRPCAVDEFMDYLRRRSLEAWPLRLVGKEAD